IEEAGIDRKTGQAVVRIDPTYFRPTEVDLLIGDASKARKTLGWKPKTSFAQLVKEMVAGDLTIARQEAANGKHTVSAEGEDRFRRRLSRDGWQRAGAPAGAGRREVADGRPRRSRPARSGRGVRLVRGQRSAGGVPRGGEGRWHRRQRHATRRIPLRESGDRG